jgi:hypothetical protein
MLHSVITWKYFFQIIFTYNSIRIPQNSFWHPSCSFRHIVIPVSGDRSCRADKLPPFQKTVSPETAPTKKEKVQERTMTPRVRIPEKEKLIKILSFLIDVHPINPIRSTSLTFIYLGLHGEYPGIISYKDLNHISRRKKTPEQLADAILLIWQRRLAET